MRQGIRGPVAFVVAVGCLTFVGQSASARDAPAEVDAALEYAAREWGPPGGHVKMNRVSDCESGFNPSAYNRAGPYVGLFQHRESSWPGRVRAFNNHVRLHNSRNPHQRLPEMAGDWRAPIDAARVTAAMAAGVLPGYPRGWSHWPHCGRR